MVGQTPWTTDELATMLRCHRSHTTARMERFTETCAGFTAMPRDESVRSDRLAEKMLAFLRTGGRLAKADPDGLRRLLAELTEQNRH